MTQYTYHKKFSRFSIGGVSTPIDRRTAKGLITRMKGKILPERFRYIGERTIQFDNGNYIFIYTVNTI